MRRPTHPAREKELVTAQFGLLKPGRDGKSGWLSEFELDWSLCLALCHDGPRDDLVSMRDIAHAQTDEIAAPKLTVDGQVEHREIADCVCVLKVNANRPDVLQLEGWLLAYQFSLVPGFAFRAR